MTTDAQAVLQQVVDSYLAAYAKQDAEQCAAFYATDGMILSPYGSPSIGREAIRGTHAEWFEESESNKVMTVLNATLGTNDGSCIIAYSADVVVDGTVVRAHGASLNTVVRHPDDGWLLRYTSINEIEQEMTRISP